MTCDFHEVRSLYTLHRVDLWQETYSGSRPDSLALSRRSESLCGLSGSIPSAAHKDAVDVHRGQQKKTISAKWEF